MNDNIKILEGFEDAFDSSLVDYSDDFQKSDKEMLKKKIDIWINLFLAPDKSASWGKRSLLDYTINDDLSIELNNSFILFDTAYACFKYKLSKSRYWINTLEENYDSHILEYFYSLFDKFNYNYNEIKYSYSHSKVRNDALESISRYLKYYNMDGNSDISIHEDDYLKIPSWINIKNCTGDFSVTSATKLISLRGLPKNIDGTLILNNLTTLEDKPFIGGPNEINSLDANKCKLTNDMLEGLPIIKRNIFLNYNNLTSLQGLPEIINGDLYISNNKLANLKGSVKCVKGSIIAYEQQPDYGELYSYYRSLKGIDDVTEISDNMLYSIMGPRGIRYFGVELIFGYNPPTAGHWKFEADWSKAENGMPVPKLIEGPENSVMLNGIWWWNPATKTGKPLRWIKEEKPNMNEGFENTFDSSLIDYSSDFKEQDIKQATINDIENWIEFFIETNSHDKRVKYKINDDLSIDLLNNKSGNLNKEFEYFCIRPFKQFKLHTFTADLKTPSKTIIYTDFTDNFGNPLPIDRLPDFINIRNVAGGFSCQGCDLVSLKGCPSGIVEGSYDCTHNNLENFDYLPKQCKSIDARWQKGKKTYDEKYVDLSNIINSLNNRTFDIVYPSESYFELWIPKEPGSMEGYETYLQAYIENKWTWEDMGKTRIYSLGTRTTKIHNPDSYIDKDWNYRDIKKIIQKHYPEKYEEFINKIK